MIYSDAKPRFSAIAAGTVCLDIFPGLASVKVTDFERDFMPGRVVETDATVFSTGGSVSNTGLALVRLGVKTRLIGKIGRDPFGEIVSDFYRKSGESLTDGLQTDPDLMTSHSFVISPSGEDRRFIHIRVRMMPSKRKISLTKTSRVPASSISATRRQCAA